MSSQPHKKLNQYFATAICGNDILSSALYVSGIAIIYAGVYATIVLLLIRFVLYLYKGIYTEVVEALPVNGGAYNCLLNGTSKRIAAVAGVTTFLSYMATAVISATTGVEYLHTIVTSVPIIASVIILLGLFALLVIAGIKDSAKVALGIFVVHVIVLTAFLVFGAVHAFTGHSYFAYNLAHTKDLIKSGGGIIALIYFGFCTSLLGVSGFESSANFVEEQDKGVFRKTLRNMLVGVVIFNPLIALVVLNSMPYEAIAAAKDFLLSNAGLMLGGSIFQYIVVIDAFLVLSGAVLTAYVGVSGLVSRMAADNCVPFFLAKENKKGSFPRIIIGFFVLCTSILLLTRGNLLSLAGVYTIAFLGVMSMFAIGNLILKESRRDLKRTYRAKSFFVVIALLSTVLGIAGNIRVDSNNITFFDTYFIPSILLVALVLYRRYLYSFFIRITQGFPKINETLRKSYEKLVTDQYVVFISGVNRLFPILSYINRNELGKNITLVHCKPFDTSSDQDKSYDEICEAVAHLQKAQAFPTFKVQTVKANEYFGPEAIDKAATDYGIKRNRIFIGSLHESHPFDYEDLGGVRIIL